MPDFKYDPVLHISFQPFTTVVFDKNDQHSTCKFGEVIFACNIVSCLQHESRNLRNTFQSVK